MFCLFQIVLALLGVSVAVASQDLVAGDGPAQYQSLNQEVLERELKALGSKKGYFRQ